MHQCLPEPKPQRDGNGTKKLEHTHRRPQSTYGALADCGELQASWHNHPLAVTALKARTQAMKTSFSSNYYQMYRKQQAFSSSAIGVPVELAA